MPAWGNARAAVSGRTDVTTMLARLGAIAAALALSACATHTDINEVRNMALKGTDFHKALHKEYIALAVKELG